MVVKCKLLIIYMVHLTFYLITIGSWPLIIKLCTTYLMALTLGVIVHAYSYQNTHHYIQIIQSLANDYDFPTNFFFFSINDLSSISKL